MTRAVVRYGSDVAAPTPDVDMSTSLSTFEMPSPILTASGCAASGREGFCAGAAIERSRAAG